MLYKQIAKETGRDLKELQSELHKVAAQIQEHEHEIIDKIFEKGSMEGITPEQMKVFVNHRLNLCLSQLGLDPIFDETHNPIRDWFYDMISAPQLHDFFAGLGSDYNRNWSESKFKW